MRSTKSNGDRMNLISCKSCGIVYDQNRVNFPSEERIFDNQKSRYNLSLCTWSEEKQKYVPMIRCYICQNIVEKLE